MAHSWLMDYDTALKILYKNLEEFGKQWINHPLNQQTVAHLEFTYWVQLREAFGQEVAQAVKIRKTCDSL